jgi:hypothetical protein
LVPLLDVGMERVGIEEEEEGVDTKSAPCAKHTASRTSWLHTRRDSKTCQSIFPEN